MAAVLGAPPHTTPVDQVPPGRGYARLGSGPVHRLQVPATPDPYDDATSDAHRQAVLDLLPPRTTPVDEEPERPDEETAAPGAGAGESVRLDKVTTEKVPVETGAPTDRTASDSAPDKPVPAEAAVAETS